MLDEYAMFVFLIRDFLSRRHAVRNATRFQKQLKFTFVGVRTVGS